MHSIEDREKEYSNLLVFLSFSHEQIRKISRTQTPQRTNTAKEIFPIILLDSKEVGRVISNF